MTELPGSEQAEVLRICNVLKSLADREGITDEERGALEEAALAVSAVYMGRATARAFRILKESRGGELSDELKSRLRARGINVDELEADEEVGNRDN